MNRNVFPTQRACPLPPPADTVNDAGGAAYSLTDKEALAQLAVTGCFNQTYYAAAEDQKDAILKIAKRLIHGGEAGFVSKTAVYARKHGHMKDAPALLAGLVLANIADSDIRAEAWSAIDNVKMLRNLVQVIRSGVTGRKSFGSQLKHEVQHWINMQDLDVLFKGSVGTQPSLGDAIKLTHPRPRNPIRDAFYGYLVDPDELTRGKVANLPACVKEFETFKRDLAKSEGKDFVEDRVRRGKRELSPGINVPDVPADMLTSLPLRVEHWRRIALNSGWHWLRMNLNTLGRHGCFGPGTVGEDFIHDVALRLRDPERIKKSRVFPYQILTTFTNLGPDTPQEIAEALHEAMEIATDNVPAIGGELVVCPDVSGSMSAPITGSRKGATSKTACIQVAALIATVLARANPKTWLLPFENQVLQLRNFTLRDSILTNAVKLASIGGGGTDCSAPLKVINHYKKSPDLVVFISDNESWMDSNETSWGAIDRRGATGTMAEWTQIKKRAPKAKLACIDLTPNAAKQAPTRKDILNVGGFSDTVFEVLSDFVTEGKTWVQRIEDA